MLLEFISINNCDYKWLNDNEVMLFIDIDDIKEWFGLFDGDIFDEGGIKCEMLNGYFAFGMRYICGYYGIKLTDIFKK